MQISTKFYSVPFFSSKSPSPCHEAITNKPTRDWRCELASASDNQEILSFVGNNFLKEEALVRTLIPGPKPKLLLEIFRKMLEQELTVVARQQSGEKKLVGVSINERSSRLDVINLCKLIPSVDDCNLKKLLEVWAMIHVESKLHETLACNEIFHSVALTVAESHYGQGIGIELTKRSFELAREKNFKFAKMNCTNDNTRKIAEELNMIRAWSSSYKEIMKSSVMPDPPHCSANAYYIDLLKI